jgi:hypothetical protein
MPIRFTRTGCCARAPSDQIVAAPPKSVKKSRRLKLSECMCALDQGSHHILRQRANADKRYFSIEPHLPSHCLKLR